MVEQQKLIKTIFQSKDLYCHVEYQSSGYPPLFGCTIPTALPLNLLLFFLIVRTFKSTQ